MQYYYHVEAAEAPDRDQKRKIPSEIWLEIIEKVSGGTFEAPMRDQSRFFVYLFAVLGLCGTMVWTYFETKKQFSVVQEIIKKQVHLKTRFLDVFVAFQGFARTIFIDFWSQKWSPELLFQDVFR